MGADAIADLISTAELAKRRRVDQSTARRWLLRMDAKHGGVVFRSGTGRNAKLFTTATALARIAPEMALPDPELRRIVQGVQKDFETLNDRTTTLMGRVRELAARVSSLERRKAK